MEIKVYFQREDSAVDMVGDDRYMKPPAGCVLITGTDTVDVNGELAVVVTFEARHEDADSLVL